jgi:lipopolysaccharide transport system ATP-binding protein
LSPWAVVAEGIGKRYRISEGKRPDTLFGAIREAFGSMVSRSDADARTLTSFWALRDLSFEIDVGERIGILGGNGAGKSTLLKILSRVTAPTEGKARLRGRIASLLEVGTGFHPELTGRENVYLNGAILGLSREDVDRVFDAIVDFAGVETFIDTPIKHYSSGMQVRLAFAVAAQLEPDIMIIDEVLAVGDAAFTSKSQNRIDEAAREGRTILFVSHSMQSVRKLCNKAILLEKGRITCVGDTDQVIERYEQGSKPPKTLGRIPLLDWKNRTWRDAGARIAWAEVATEEEGDGSLHIGAGIRISFGVKLERERVGRPIKLAVKLVNGDGIALANMIDTDSNFAIESARAEETVSVVLRDIRFYPGLYYASLWVGSTASEVWDCTHDCIVFEIASGGKLTQRRLPREAGLLFLTPEWTRA